MRPGRGGVAAALRILSCAKVAGSGARKRGFLAAGALRCGPRRGARASSRQRIAEAIHGRVRAHARAARAETFSEKAAEAPSGWFVEPAPVSAGHGLAGADGGAVRTSGDARAGGRHGRCDGKGDGRDHAVGVAGRRKIQDAGSGRCGAEGTADAKVTQVSLTVCGREGPDG